MYDNKLGKDTSNQSTRLSRTSDLIYYPDTNEPIYPESNIVNQDYFIESNIEDRQVTKDKYVYTKDLLALEAGTPKVPPLLLVLGKSISSPLIVNNWKVALRNHPDHAFVNYILQGLTHSFHIGFDRETKCRSTRNNMKSALDNPGPVDKYLEEEL